MNRRPLPLALFALLLGCGLPLAVADIPPALAAPAKVVAPGYHVVVGIAFKEDGVSEGAEIVESDDPTNDTILNRIALNLASKIKQEPRLKDGKPVKFTVVVPFDFPVEGDEGAAANQAPRPTPKSFGQRPAYPENLAAAGEVGGAILELVIGTDGSVTKVTTLRASHPEFAQSAATAVRTWVFGPAMKNGVPVESRWRTVIGYSTEGRELDWKWRVAPRPSLGGSIVFPHRRAPAPEAATPATPPVPAGPAPEKK
jgi:TonB family protein